MIPQYIHNLSSSFSLWLDHVILKRGFAYENQTGTFTSYTDGNIPSSWKAWGSPHKQWVSDSSITGATIPSGFFANSSFSGRSSNVILDFENGRFLTNGLSTSAAVTGAYSVKEFNVYATNQDEESLIIEKVQETANQKIGTNINTQYLPPYDQKLPALFINVQTQENEPFAFGGMDKSVNRINVIALTQTPYQLDGVLGLLADTSDEIFKEIPLESSPYTEQGDLKDGAYNYETLAAQSSDYYTIESAKSSKVTDSLRRSLGTQLYIGMIDFEVWRARNPRNNSV
jgi:hypothetical protein